MTTRRGFLGGVLASGFVPAIGWADAGSPGFLNAARQPDGQYVLVGLTKDGAELFRLPIPDRGHAATAHPNRPEAVGFARRPGTFAYVVDCSTGAILHRLNSPEGRHFYGHGAFSQDGTTLFTTENDYELGEGRIGVWDVAAGYKRISEFASGGIGPHEIKRIPGRETLVIANGGIDTHPDSGRTKLNIPTMQPNLTYLSPTGQILETVSLTQNMHMNSIRHLAVSNDGTVAFGMQWQTTSEAPALLGLHKMGKDLRLPELPQDIHHRMKGYVGSVAMTPDGAETAISSPRGGLVLVFDTQSGALLKTLEEPDVCGLGTLDNGFAISTGTGRFGAIEGAELSQIRTHDLQFDNHLVAVTG